MPGETKAPEIFGFDFTEPAWQVRAGDQEFRTGDEDSGGLWRLAHLRAPVRVRAGKYGVLLVTPDGKWLIAGKAQNADDQALRALVRINLQTNKEFVVNQPESDQTFTPVAFIQAHNKVLIKGESTDSNKKDYFLLNPETGAAVPIKGEFDLLETGQEQRPLQPTAAQSHLLWAAIPNQKTNSTRFGVYDTLKFVFKPLLELPDINFKSTDTWVDEPEKTLYLVYEGQLLKLPLPARLE